MEWYSRVQDANGENAIGRDPEKRQSRKAERLKQFGVIPADGGHFSVDDFDIWMAVHPTNFEFTFAEPPEGIALYIALSGVMEVCMRDRQFVLPPGMLLAVPFSNLRLLRINAEHRHIGLAFSQNAIINQLTRLLEVPVMHELDLFAVCDVTSGAGAGLTTLARVLWDRFVADSEAAGSAHSTVRLFQAMMLIMLESFPHRYSVPPMQFTSPAVPKQIKRAIEYMTANIAASPNVVDIARAAGVSVRALQLAFQEFKSTTPSKYLRQMRLEGARKDLLAHPADDMSVSDVARRWGFTHMGRFSAFYREAFGELPSETW
ncbi:AraC family transcriptional regulator [Rhizobium leguminosarum]|uniref:AraC family transcriptional regulator n=1 Tax=Rhizobium leguminosarum TaxID=384 RepID=A0ACD5FDR7_RHILE